MQLIRAGKDGIYKIRIYINGSCLSIYGVSRRYSEKEGGILLSNMRFAKLVTAMISSDTNGFIRYVDSDSAAMSLQAKTVNVLWTELSKIKFAEALRGGDKLTIYKKILKEAVKSKSKVQLVMYAAS